MFAIDAASIRQEDELVWLGTAPMDIAWLLQSQVLSVTRIDRIEHVTHLGCEIIGYTTLLPDALPVQHMQTALGRPLYLRRVFYLSPDYDHSLVPEYLPEDLIVSPDSLGPRVIGDIGLEAILGSLGLEDEDEDDEEDDNEFS